MLKFHLRLFYVFVLLVLAVSAMRPAQPGLAQTTPPPEVVAIPGTLQSKLGCPGDWQPECEKTFLTYDLEDDVWQGIFELPAGNYEYKVALNKSWTENYGLNAKRDGPNIPLALSEQRPVKFYYDHKSHWVTDNVNSLIVTLVGDFQSEIGCKQDDDPGCLRAWLQDVEGTGTYSFATSKIPAGDYNVRVALNESQDEIYGADGIQGGQAIQFSVPLRAVVYFGFDAVTKRLVVSTEGAPRGNLFKAQAHWVSPNIILWGVQASVDNVYTLHYAAEGGIRLELGKIRGGQELPLIYEPAAPPKEVIEKFPHLAKSTMLKLRPEDVAKVPEILKGQIAITARNAQGRLIDATSLQISGVLDDLFTYTGKLGVSFENDAPVLKVWAPTARSVKLHLFPDSRSTSISTLMPMEPDPITGVWSITGEASWVGQFYLYEVTVFVPSLSRVVSNLVTDPYSISLSQNSLRSQIVDLDDPALMPKGWKELQKPSLEAPEDIVIYELHVRDFSAFDPSVPEQLRGTFKAFTELNSNGMKHLRSLAEAGLTHVHLLPAFDIATIDEEKTNWKQPSLAQLEAFPPDSIEQQKLIGATRGQDGYNWGYDPYHYNVPEGSYASNPDGSTRILEFREMVQALNAIGLRVVMDVVYNHTNASGQNNRSVLDKIVPGYYHRLNADGVVTTSTCCQNTATEHTMMEKLMVDSVLLWATAYKVDGFRFDLMGHHMLSNMVKLRAALDGLTLEKDGVDGKSIYVYGEGWNFGEVANNARGRNATQLNIAGTGIGVFNDRLRDGARGGGPFSGVQEQGFVTGLFYDPNDSNQGNQEDQKFRLLRYTDWIRLGLAGNLREYELVNFIGQRKKGEDIDYNGNPAGYTLDPQENVVYVSAHDNETLFDAIQLKASQQATLDDRVRMQNLGMSLVMFSQGIPFFHAGDEMLRSKSLDRNSYDSGDWFNRLDFTYETNNFGVGLPPEWENSARWSIMQPILANPALKPQKADILTSVENFKELLKIRRSSLLFRLRDGEEIKQRLSFGNTGPKQVPAVILMKLSDTIEPDLDPYYELVVVVFNANPGEIKVEDANLIGVELELHPIQVASHDELVRRARFDPVSGVFTVPGRTTAVFVAKTVPARTVIATPTVTPLPEPVITTSQEQPTVVSTLPETLVVQASPAPTSAQTTGLSPVAIAAGIVGGAILLLGLVLYLRQRKA